MAFFAGRAEAIGYVRETRAIRTPRCDPVRGGIPQDRQQHERTTSSQRDIYTALSITRGSGNMRGMFGLVARETRAEPEELHQKNANPPHVL
ncbi:MAG: hypothetical protein PVJ83_06860 [Gammaproteobacteria bacterium]|jgi:hypothetical protein